MQRLYASLDIRLTRWMAYYGITLLRISLGIVFFWFGILKFFPGVSPAENLAVRTIHILTFGLIPDHISIILLAAWETLIGLGMLTGVFMRATLLLLWLQMMGAMTPLFLLPQDAFTRIPYAPTLEGQYIIKNLVLISAGIVIGATVRGGRLTAEPQIERSEQAGT